MWIFTTNENTLSKGEFEIFDKKSDDEEKVSERSFESVWASIKD